MVETIQTVRERKSRQSRGISSASSTGAKGDEGVDEVTLGLCSAIAIIIALLALGATMATVYIVTFRPGCWTITKSTTTKVDIGTAAATSLRKDVPQEQAKAAPLPLFESGFPPACTAEQRSAIQKQLPPGECYKSPFMQACSFTVATKGCQTHKLVREFYVNQYTMKDSDFPFLGIMVGWRLDDVPIDMLYLGSRDPKYDRAKWHAKTGSNDGCKATLTAPADREIQKAQILVVEWNFDHYQLLSQVKRDFAFTDDEMIVDMTNPDTAPENALSKIITSKLPGENRPIHYLEIVGRENDYTVLMRQLSADVLKNVRYLAFEYNWKGAWSSPSVWLGDLISRLKKHAGLVCYWSGDSTNQGLWRITDCWLDHYNAKQWARISCVNTQHDDVSELKDQMENTFLETLKKSQ